MISTVKNTFKWGDFVRFSYYREAFTDGTAQTKFSQNEKIILEILFHGGDKIKVSGGGRLGKSQVLGRSIMGIKCIMERNEEEGLKYSVKSPITILELLRYFNDEVNLIFKLLIS